METTTGMWEYMQEVLMREHTVNILITAAAVYSTLFFTIIIIIIVVIIE
jgi:hypothetical protein